MLIVRKGNQDDIDEVAALYDELNDYLESNTNYPGWKKGIYPAREDAEQGIQENNLFVAIEKEQIVGTFILRHEPEEAYSSVDWGNELDYQDIFVLYTFAVHPRFLHEGVGRQMLQWMIDYAAQMRMKEIRLDVYDKNQPAIHLYESLGFQYIATVDLGYSMYGLEWFKLYKYVVTLA